MSSLLSTCVVHHVLFLKMEGYDAELFASSPSDVETFHFDDLHIRLSCSKAATTDFDETGHIVWPASRVLSWYLKQTDLVRDQHVLEIGCGCGLVGIVSHSLEAASVTFTDRDPQISKILSRTFSLNRNAWELLFSKTLFRDFNGDD